MKNEIHSRTGRAHRIEIDKVSLAQVDAIPNLRQVLAFPRREIVHAPYLLATRNQRPRNRRSNKAANASNEIESHAHSS